MANATTTLNFEDDLIEDAYDDTYALDVEPDFDYAIEYSDI